MRNRLMHLACLIGLLALPNLAQAVLSDMSLKTMSGHAGAVNAVAASFSRIATGSSDGTVNLWSTNGDTLFYPLVTPDGGSVFSLAFSPDGSQLAVGTGMGNVWMYDVAAPATPRQFAGLTGTIMSISFSTDGRIAAGDNMGTIAVWGVVPGGTPMATIPHGYAVRALLFSADNNYLLVGGVIFNTVAIYPSTGGSPVGSFAGNGADIYSLALSPAGNVLVSGGADGTIRVWNYADRVLTNTIPNVHAGMAAKCLAAFTDDTGRLLAVSGGNDNAVKVWVLSTGALEAELYGHTGGVNSVALIPGQKRVVSGSADMTAKIWGDNEEPPVDMSIATFPHEGPVLGVASSPNGDSAATIAGELLRLWGEAGNLYSVNPELGQLTAVAWSPNGAKIAVGGTMYVQALDAATGLNPQSFQGLQATVKSIAFSPDGNYLAGGDVNGNLYVWNTGDGSVRWRAVELGGAINSVVFSPDGAFVVAAGEFGNYGARLFGAASGAPGNNFYGNEGPVKSLAFLPDGTRLFSGAADGTIRSWYFPTADTAVTIYGAHSGGAVNCIGIGPNRQDSYDLASGGDDNNLRIWNLYTGEQQMDPGALTGHTGPIVSLALMGDWGGITGSLDGTAKIWGGDGGGGSSGPTDVAGMINSTTWTRDGSPYRIVGPVLVPPSETLNIDSGVEVQFVTNVPLLVYGTLNTYGGYMDSVRFHGFDSNWAGIRFMSTAMYTSSSLNGIVVEGASAPGGTTFADSCGGGIYVGPGRQVQINGSVIRANNAPKSGGGIYVDSGALSVSNSVVEGNSAGFFGGGIGGANSSVNASQSVVRNNSSEQYGGGISVVHQAEVHLWQTAVERNYAQLEGGGIAVYDSVYLQLENSFVESNQTNGMAGGIMSRKAVVNLHQSVLGENYAQMQGGALYADSSQVNIQQSTVADNTSRNAGGELVLTRSSVDVHNAIIWGNTSPVFNFESVSGQAWYSDLQDPWPLDGGNNLSVDPAFMIDPMTGNTYMLTAGSMCIDAGSPDSGMDPDGTRRDMGAFFFWQEGMQKRLVLPQVNAEPGSEVLVDIRATHQSLVSTDLFFTIDSNVFTPAEGFVRFNVFDNLPGSEPIYAPPVMVGDTVKISLASNTNMPAFLQDGVLITLAFNVNPEAQYGWYGMNWLPDAYLPSGEWVHTNLNEEMVYMEWGGIELQQQVLWGDVTMDATVSGSDASAILRYVVGLPNAMFDREVADVTNNGSVSSFDAALILRKVIYPSFQFPVEGHQLAAKPAAGTFASLSWERDGSGWVLRSNTSGIEAGELTLTLAGDAPVTISGDNAFAYRQDGMSLQIALVNAVENGILFRLDGVTAAPVIASASFNEGAMTLAPMLPTAFALEQNAPNPFNPSTTIRFALPEASQVNLVVYDLNGRAIRTLAATAYQAGNHSVVWDGMDANGREVASGTYVYRLTTDKGSFVKRMTLAR